MSILRIIWQVYRWVAIITGSIVILSVVCSLGYKAIFEPDTVPVSCAFAEQQLGIPCSSVELTRARWDKRYHIFSATLSTRRAVPAIQALPADRLAADLAAAGWVEQPGMPGARRIFERQGLTLLLVQPDSLLAFPAWMTAQKPSATLNLRTPRDVRKLSQN